MSGVAKDAGGRPAAEGGLSPLGQPLDEIEVRLARRTPTCDACRNGRPKLFVEAVCPRNDFAGRHRVRQLDHGSHCGAKVVAELALQVVFHAGWGDRSVLADGSQTVGRAHDRHGSVQEVDVQGGSRLCLLEALVDRFGGRLEWPERDALGIGVEAGDRASQRQRRVVVKTQSLGDDRRPQGQDGSPVDADRSSLRQVPDLTFQRTPYGPWSRGGKQSESPSTHLRAHALVAPRQVPNLHQALRLKAPGGVENGLRNRPRRPAQLAPRLVGGNRAALPKLEEPRAQNGIEHCEKANEKVRYGKGRNLPRLVSQP